MISDIKWLNKDTIHNINFPFLFLCLLFTFVWKLIQLGMRKLRSVGRPDLHDRMTVHHATGLI